PGFGVRAGAESVRLIPYRGNFRFDGGGILGLVEHFLTNFEVRGWAFVNRMVTANSIKKPPRRPERLFRKKQSDQRRGPRAT
ncbi:hypothetical protein ACC697_39375, partial [Rhizobium ruizarguesonis]